MLNRSVHHLMPRHMMLDAEPRSGPELGFIASKKHNWSPVMSVNAKVLATFDRTLQMPDVGFKLGDGRWINSARDQGTVPDVDPRPVGTVFPGALHARPVIQRRAISADGLTDLRFNFAAALDAVALS